MARKKWIGSGIYNQFQNRTLVKGESAANSHTPYRISWGSCETNRPCPLLVRAFEFATDSVGSCGMRAPACTRMWKRAKHQNRISFAIL